MKILVVDGGGRGHSIAEKLSQSPRKPEIFVAPGNGGTSEIATNVQIETIEIFKLAEFAEKNKIDLTIVGPDEPLALGISDVFKSKKLRIFAPTRGASKIEWSKLFAKDIMTELGIQTAQFTSYSSMIEAVNDFSHKKFPIIIKADGLMRGKGVEKCKNIAEAERFLKRLVNIGKFGRVGQKVIAEECLPGREVSIHALSDGKISRMFPSSQDYKKLTKDPDSRNTGGMGAFAPAWFDAESVKGSVVDPILGVLSDMGHQYVGCLYPGLMIDNQSWVKVLEFNARFGDPETQVYMELLETDLIDLCEACVDGTLDQIEIKWKPGFAVCVVLAGEGYPDKPKTGELIEGIESAEKLPDVSIYHAGTVKRDGKFYTAGGRVLSVVARARTLYLARAKVYEAISYIHFEGMQYRDDIGDVSH